MEAIDEVSPMLRFQGTHCAPGSLAFADHRGAIDPRSVLNGGNENRGYGVGPSC